MYTPWGASQSVERVIDGIVFVETASHGGFKLDAARNLRMPLYLRREGGWYEEDCEWCLPMAVFEAEVLAHAPESWAKTLRDGNHTHTMANWFPEEYEKFFGVELLPGQSYKKDRTRFYAEHAGDWLVISAVGDWHKGVPKGYVGVCARIGGHENPHGQERFFLVPDDEYDERGPYSFVVDPARHPETTGEYLPVTKRVQL